MSSAMTASLHHLQLLLLDRKFQHIYSQLLFQCDFKLKTKYCRCAQLCKSLSFKVCLNIKIYTQQQQENLQYAAQQAYFR